MKEFLQKIISAKQARAAELRNLIKDSNDVNEVRRLGAELQTTLDEERAAQTQLDTLDETRGFNPVATYGVQQSAGTQARTEDRFDTVEYRTAFMNFVCRGVAMPTEMREDATTTTADANVVIPTSMLHEIIKKLDTYGSIWAKVRKLNVQGGVEIPILSLKPVATWITADTATSESEKQKLQMNQKITFSYFGLECKLSQTLLANVVTLDMFQNLFVSLATEAIIRALEVAIIKGTGSGQMTGITVDTRVPAANVITLAAADIAKWDQWKKKVFAKMKKAYRNGEFVMSQATFDGYIDGMVDNNGQPIGRVNYGIDGGENYRFGGKTVMTVEDELIASYDDASAGDVIALFVNFNDYAVNTNMQLTVTKWTDHDTNELKNKAMLIADGKLVDPNGVLVIKKG